MAFSKGKCLNFIFPMDVTNRNWDFISTAARLLMTYGRNLFDEHSYSTASLAFHIFPAIMTLSMNIV